MKKNMLSWWNLQKYLKNEKGQGMVEYALVVAIIGVACVVSMQGVRDQIRLNFGAIVTALQQAMQ